MTAKKGVTQPNAKGTASQKDIEPIERDFTYLGAAAWYMLNKGSFRWRNFGVFDGGQLNKLFGPYTDTRNDGVVRLVYEAENDAGVTQDNYPADKVFKAWLPKYLKEVRLILERYDNAPALLQNLERLIAEVKGWYVWPELKENVLLQGIMDVKTAEHAQKELLDELRKRMPEKHTNNLTMERLEWHGSTIEFVTVVQNLVRSGYMDLPSKNGKGDGNETELFRRLQQVFIVRNKKGVEITPELVKNRAVGRRIGGAREKQFELPDATRKKGKKAK